MRPGAFLWIGLLVLGLVLRGSGQENPTPSPNGAEQTVERSQTIRVGVEEVRVDAVVVDKKGHQITDLTASDFEIYQDGQPQKITSSIYVREIKAQPEKKIITSQDSQKVQPIPTLALARESVRRTIVFLVDDASMTFPDLHNARLCLQKFVETQMQPGDLVSIMQTKGGSAGLQVFTSDKRQLLARIGSIRWTTHSNPKFVLQPTGIMYCLRALRDMPGRKFLLLVSSDVMVGGSEDATIVNMLADEALRAGVVIHTLDILGLINIPIFAQMNRDGTVAREINNEKAILNAMDVESSYGNQSAEAKNRRRQADDRILLRPNPLPGKTGGLFVTGNNFFLKGIGDVEEEMKGYYLLSYTPPANTFESASFRDYHKIRVLTKRPGSDVHTRDGFYGMPGILKKPDDPIMDAMSSPFLYYGLKTDLASGYVFDSPKGYLLRAWLHLDGQRLNFIDEKDGSRSVALQVMATTSDITGLVQNSGEARIKFPLGNKDMQWIRENGFRIFISLPTIKPGSYYLRVAVKDQASGAIGSAYLYVEIPDIKKDLSLSSIFVLNRDTDASWIQSGASEESGGKPDSSQQAARRSQAIRSYLPGESIDYMAIAYNAKTEEELKPGLESRITLFRNGREQTRTRFEKVDLKGVKDYGRIPIRKKLKLLFLQPGDYVLQLEVTDKRVQKSLATQTLDFEISAKSSNPAESPDEAKYDKTVVEMTPEELQQSYHKQLSSLEFNQNTSELSSILEAVGNRVVAFFRDFSNTSSKERVEMTEYRSGSPIKSLVKEYQYLILPGSGKTEDSWVEDRADMHNRHVSPKEITGFYMGSGYAGYCLYLHPNHQVNSDFRYLGREKKSRAYVIAFAQKPESRDYLAQSYDFVSSTTFRFLVQGFIWVDPDTYQISRMYTRMMLPGEKTSVRETTTDISYGSVRFDNNPKEFWLPQEVTVNWDFGYWNYASWHKYSDYHLFTVQTDYKLAPPTSNK